MTKEEIIASKIKELKSLSGSHSPSIETVLQSIPEIEMQIDACFLSNPYATDLFLEYLQGEVLQNHNFYKYKRLIELENDASLVIENNTIQLYGKRITEIEVKNNYYFVLGDNRDNAIDSRYWGLLSEQSILGKITRKLISNKD